MINERLNKLKDENVKSAKDDFEKQKSNILKSIKDEA